VHGGLANDALILFVSWHVMPYSTDDPITKATWQRLGFEFTSEEALKEFGVGPKDLLHMDNTVQMHKWVPSPRTWKSLVLKHQSWRQRVYYPA
jgi:hypothetical protein